jgi:hypothetical protein
MKKAMKQRYEWGKVECSALSRRGSVDNVAEALMESLASSGQSQEAIARAMVKALQATGATPQEIAKTMQSAMSKSGASQVLSHRTAAPPPCWTVMQPGHRRRSAR